MEKQQCLFGPIFSRRLGVSLGINLIPNKTCNLNCVYCEVGSTIQFSTERKDFYPTESIIQEIKDFLKNHDPSQKIDAFTFSGAGEPTLAANLGEIIRFLKNQKLKAKIVVITNSILLNNPAVIEDLLLADIVMPSLDAATQDLFQKIDRSKDYHIQDVINGLIHFRKKFSGKLELEIFLAYDEQLEPDQIKAYQKAIDQIKPDSIDINTLDRLGANSELVTISSEKVEKFKQLLGFVDAHNLSQLNQSFHKKDQFGATQLVSTETAIDTILNILAIRVGSMADFRVALNLSENQLQQILESLIREKKIQKTFQNQTSFYHLFKKG